MLGHLRLRTSLRVLRSIGGMGSGDHGACATGAIGMYRCDGLCVVDIGRGVVACMCIGMRRSNPNLLCGILEFLARRVNHVLIELGSRSGDDGGHGHADYRTCDADLRRQQKRCHRGQGACQQLRERYSFEEVFHGAFNVQIWLEARSSSAPHSFRLHSIHAKT